MNPSKPVTTDSDGTIDVIALWRLMWSNKILLAGIAGLFGIVAAILALTATPIYRAEAVVTPVANSGLGGAASSIAGRFGGLASLAGIDLDGGSAGAKEAQAVLESRRLVEEFIRRNELVDEIVPPGGVQSTLWYAVQIFRDAVLVIDTDDVDATTTVAIEWKDPNVAENWANGLVALANESMRAKALADSRRNIEYLNKQISATNVVEMQRVMYELIESETKTLMLANARADYAFTVIDPAVAPESRIRPKRKLMVVTGIALGFMLGALFVFGRDTVRRYRSREGLGETVRS